MRYWAVPVHGEWMSHVRRGERRRGSEQREPQAATRAHHNQTSDQRHQTYHVVTTCALGSIGDARGCSRDEQRHSEGAHRVYVWVPWEGVGCARGVTTTLMRAHIHGAHHHVDSLSAHRLRRHLRPEARARRLADTCPHISLSDPHARHSLRALTPAALGQTSQSTRHSYSAAPGASKKLQECWLLAAALVFSVFFFLQLASPPLGAERVSACGALIHQTNLYTRVGLNLQARHQSRLLFVGGASQAQFRISLYSSKAEKCHALTRVAPCTPSALHARRAPARRPETSRPPCPTRALPPPTRPRRQTSCRASCAQVRANAVAGLQRALFPGRNRGRSAPPSAAARGLAGNSLRGV